ncbi:MAG: FAD dependent oxidoreductase [Benjaminiella poitrasii]|nr:MAG: FAD dependent oxidoreductase [Benjaminiella poitrasii]
MPKEITKHIIIIGGGVIGASCSYFLSQHEDCKITLIEQADELATGASGKSGGFIALDWCDDLPGMKDLARASYALHQTLAETLDGPERYGYRLLNTYAVTIDPSVAAQRPSRRTDHKRQPLHRRPRGLEENEDLQWAQNVKSVEQIGTTETTAQVMPPLFTKTLVEVGQETGRLQLIVGRGVSNLIVDVDNHVNGVELEDGQKVYGDQVVVCMGPWSGLLELKPERLPIDGSHVHSVVLQPAKEIPNAALFTAVVSENAAMAEPEVGFNYV